MGTLSALLLNSLWPGLAIWTVLYVSDYAWTIACARLYRAGVSERIVFDGSYEITPYFQRDIDSLRVVSPRFIMALILSLIWLSVVWWLASLSVPQMYSFALGAVILLELAIHVRHFRSFFLFRAVIRTDAVRGRVEYSRWLMLRLSSIELLTFSGVFAILFLFTESWFVLGGATACLSTAGKHWRLARKSTSGPSAGS